MRAARAAGLPPLLLAAAVLPLRCEDSGELAWCAELMLSNQLPTSGAHEDFARCRVQLLAALRTNRVPGYSYDPEEDCRFWAHYGMRDRNVEGRIALDFNRLAALRLSEPFRPALPRNATMLYIGAHRAGEDGLHFWRALGLHVHAFEPSPGFFRELQAVAGGLPGVVLHNFGVGLHARRALLHVDGTASATLSGTSAVSAHGGNPLMEEIYVLSVEDALRRIPTRQIGLLHINCEGCEYDVVEGLHAAGRLAGIEHIQIATHLLGASLGVPAVADSFGASIARYCRMHFILAQSHERVWGLPWVWERWTKRANGSRPAWEHHGPRCQWRVAPLGCWGDLEEERAVQPLEGRGLGELPGHHADRLDPFQRCAAAACRLGLPGFALQHGGSCMGSADLLRRFRIHGRSDACPPGGHGGPLANEVYQFVQ